MRMLCLSLLSSTSLVVASSAFAQTVDQTGADALEAQVPALVEMILQGGAPSATYAFDGEVTASPSGDGYDLAIPMLRFQVEDDLRGEILPIDARVIPLDGGWQRASWDFSSPIRLLNPRNENENATITFTSEDNEVVIAPEYGLVLDGGFTLDDIAVAVSGNEASMAVERVTVAIDGDDEPRDDHLYDTVSSIDVEGVDFIVKDEARITFGSLEMGGEASRQRLDLFAEMQDAVQGLDPESDAFLVAYTDLVRRHQGEKWIGDADYTMALRDLSIVSDEVTATLGAFDITMVGDGLDEPAADLGFALSFSDMSTDNLPPLFAPIVPTSAALDLLAVEAPIEAIADELYALLGEPLSEEELVGPKGRRANVGGTVIDFSDIDPMLFLGVLMGSDVEVELQELFIEAPIGYIAAEGTVEPDANASLQAVANIELRIAGLPEMIAFAQQMGGDAAQGAGLVSILAAMGRDATDDDGRAVKDFDVELTASGQVLLNGNDMSAMMGMFDQ